MLPCSSWRRSWARPLRWGRSTVSTAVFARARGLHGRCHAAARSCPDLRRTRHRGAATPPTTGDRCRAPLGGPPCRLVTSWRATGSGTSRSSSACCAALSPPGCRCTCVPGRPAAPRRRNPGPERAQTRPLPFGLDLAEQGWAPRTGDFNPAGTDNRRLADLCAAPDPGITVHCFVPDPVTTKGEGRELRRLATLHGWHTVIVVTFQPHISRARYILGQCFDGDLVMVASPAHLTPARWGFEYAYQTAGYVRAVPATRLLTAPRGTGIQLSWLGRSRSFGGGNWSARTAVSWGTCRTAENLAHGPSASLDAARGIPRAGAGAPPELGARSGELVRGLAKLALMVHVPHPCRDR